MAGSNVSQAAPGYTTKVWIIYALMLADLMINATADHNDNPSAEFWYPLVFLGVQVLLQILLLLMLAMLFFGTYAFQVGLLGVLTREFRSVLCVCAGYGTLYLGYAGCKVGLLMGAGLSAAGLWSSPLFIFFSIAQKIGALGYYTALLAGTRRLGEARWYQKGPWVNRYTGMTGGKAGEE